MTQIQELIQAILKNGFSNINTEALFFSNRSHDYSRNYPKKYKRALGF